MVGRCSQAIDTAGLAAVVRRTRSAIHKSPTAIELLARVHQRQALAPPRQDGRCLQQFLELAVNRVTGGLKRLAACAKAHRQRCRKLSSAEAARRARGDT